MARYSNVQTDFSGGLISDYILGRTDIKRVANSARTFKNFFPSLQGPAVFRSGFKHVSGLGVNTNAVKSIDMELATDIPYRVIFTPNKLEVENSDGLNKATIDTAYSAEQIADLRFSSETGELYVAHGSHKPKRLTSDAQVLQQGIVSSDGYTLNTSEGQGVDVSFTPAELFVDGEFTADHSRFEGRTTTGNWLNDSVTESTDGLGFFKNLRNVNPVTASAGDVVRTTARFSWEGTLANDDKRTFMLSHVDMPSFEAPDENILNHAHFSIGLKFQNNRLRIIQQLTPSTNTFIAAPRTLLEVQNNDLELELEVSVGSSYGTTDVDVIFRNITDGTTDTFTINGVTQEYYQSLTSGNGVKVNIQSGDVPATTVTRVKVLDLAHRNETTYPEYTSYSLFGKPQILGDDVWNFQDLEFDVEPFLENEPISKKYKITQSERYIKLVSSTNEFQPILDNANPLGMYVDYLVEGERFLGRVVDSTSSTNYTLEDPTASTVYVEPVESVLNIEDNSAQLYLLDNEETTPASGSFDGPQEGLEFDGVPIDEIHVRCDTAVFNAGHAGAWLRVGSDRRNDDVVAGFDRTETRWVRLKEHYGLSDHPVEFYGREGYNDTSSTSSARFGSYREKLTSGAVYRIYQMNPREQLWSYGPNSDGQFKITTAILQGTSGGNRTWSFVNGLSTTIVGENTAASNYNGNAITGNLSTQKQFDVFVCYNNADDSQVSVTSASNLVVANNTTVTEIANDATLTVSSSTFVLDDVDRHCMGLMDTGNVFMKILDFTSNVEVRVKLLNPVPREKRTLGYENGGAFSDFRLGAWYRNNYPRTVAKFEQRRIFGGTYRNPNFIYFSRTNLESSFQPTQDDKEALDTDAITYGLANSTAGIRWLSAARDLVIGTSGGIYRIVPNQYQFGISPKTIRLELAEEEPCERQAEVVGTSVFYPDQSGTRIMEYKYDQSLNAATSNEVTKLVYPIFLNDPVVQLAYQHTPQPRLWVRTQAGKLYCLSYHREEQFYSWSEHDLGVGAVVLDINVLHQGGSTDLDKLWIVVRRLNDVIYKEALSETSALTGDAPMLDSHLIIERTTTAVISNDVSERFVDGDVVSVIEDGVYTGDQTVSSGQVTLNNPSTAKKLIVGNRYEGELKMMFPTWDGQNRPAYGSDHARIVSIRLFLIKSFKYIVGSVNKFETVTLPDSSFTGFDKERPVSGSTYGVDRVPTIKHNEPYPLTIASITTKTDLN